MTGALHITSERHIDIATLDAPATRNALSLRMLDDLRDLVESSAGSDSRALVIDHAGPAFSSGVDIKERRTLAPGLRDHSQALCELYLALWQYPKPLICRVAGSARGGALGFLACADAVVATPAASFAFAEVRLGVAPALVGALAMARFGPGPLAPWLMLGQPFGSPVARSLGLVTHEAVGDGRDDLDELMEAVRLAGPHAVEVTKTLHRRFIQADIGALLEEMRLLSADQFAGDEGREGMAAFAERRPPAWARPTPVHQI